MEVRPNVELVTHTPSPEKVIATAAKLCYSPSSAIDLTDNMTDEEAVLFLSKLPNSHGTPFEMATFTFSIDGVSRAFSHELVRHRMASHNQRSQRYVMEGGFNYVIPEEIKNHKEPIHESGLVLEDVFIHAMEDAQDAYEFILSCLKEAGVPEKVAFENARYVLPNACETKNMVTMNVRELHHFFNQRCCSRAMPEMRCVANQMLELCKKVSPILFEYDGPPCVSGKCPESHMSCGKQAEMQSYYRGVKK